MDLSGKSIPLFEFEMLLPTAFFVLTLCFFRCFGELLEFIEKVWAPPGYPGPAGAPDPLDSYGRPCCCLADKITPLENMNE